MAESQVERALEHLGLELKAVPCEPDLDDGPGSVRCYRVRHPSGSLLLVVEIRQGPLRDVASLARHARRVARENPARAFVVAAPHLSGRARRALRERGVSYVDFAGHARIEAPGFFVHVDPGEVRRAPVPRRSAGPSPFAKKASLIPRAMLERPRRAWGVRELHRKTALSLGHASDVLRELERVGFASREKGANHLVSPERLLAAWLDFYQWDRNEIFSFQVPFQKAEVAAGLTEELAKQGIRHAFTLLLASDHVAPHVVHDQVHLYVEEEKRGAVLDFLQSSLHAQPVARGGNVHLLLPYYGPAVFYGAREVGGLPVVSDVQLFLDLARYPLRGEEAAEVLLRRTLGPRLGLSGQQVRGLLDALAIT